MSYYKFTAGHDEHRRDEPKSKPAIWCGDVDKLLKRIEHAARTHRDPNMAHDVLKLRREIESLLAVPLCRR